MCERAAASSTRRSEEVDAHFHFHDSFGSRGIFRGIGSSSSKSSICLFCRFWTSARTTRSSRSLPQSTLACRRRSQRSINCSVICPAAYTSGHLRTGKTVLDCEYFFSKNEMTFEKKSEITYRTQVIPVIVWLLFIY